MTFTHVDKPFKIKGVELKNRIVRAPHGTNIGAGTMSDALIAFHEAQAQGGAALTIVESLSVHQSSNSVLNAWTPGLSDGYRKLVDVSRGYNMRLFQLLRHAGIQQRHADGGPPWSSSDVASSLFGLVPVPMTQAMIDDVIAGYVNTATLCEQWGLDGVEVQCGHSYLIHQYLSPAYNKRTDDYGGSLENRTRFMVEVLSAIRNSVSSDFVVGVRMSPDFQKGSFTVDEVLQSALMLESKQLIDYVSLSQGNYQTSYKIIGDMSQPVGYQLDAGRQITRSIASPTMVAGRIRTLDDADLILREGDADLITITRGTIADPDLVRKSLAGEGTQVRPCIGCNQGCVGGMMSAVVGAASKLGCTVNPTVGRELELGGRHLTRAEVSKKVLVVGGGVGGMEAARVAASRGHRVVLAEARNDLGGMVKIAAMGPTRHGMHDIAIWQENEIFELGVEVRLSTFVDVDDVVAEAPDAVIIATGSEPRMDGIVLSNPGEPTPGVDQRHVISSVDLFTGAHGNLGETAVVVDDVGHHEGLSVAEELLNRGLNVTFVTRHAGIGHQLDLLFVTGSTLGRFAHHRFTLHARSHVVSIGTDTVDVAPTYITVEPNPGHIVRADTVVFVTANRPNRYLVDELAGKEMHVQVIGDARSPRLIDQAIREGFDAAMRI
jgi:2,4-dienoyl-CoA reductase-like NADH-dependent reductase (Old Yellow Enzyme family)